MCLEFAMLVCSYNCAVDTDHLIKVACVVISFKLFGLPVTGYLNWVGVLPITIS